MSEEIHVHEHASLIKTPKQLIVVVVLAFVVPIAIISVIAHLVTGGTHAEKGAECARRRCSSARCNATGRGQGSGQGWRQRKRQVGVRRDVHGVPRRRRGGRAENG